MQNEPGKYEQAARAIGAEVDVKNQAYGDSVGQSGDILRILYPNGVQPHQYGDMQLVTRIIDKLFRIATDKHALGESPYRDISGYGTLGMVKDAENAETIQEAARIATTIVSDAITNIDHGYRPLRRGDRIQPEAEYCGTDNVWYRVGENDKGKIFDPDRYNPMRTKL